MLKVYPTVLLALLFSSCDVFDKEESIPSFVHISYAEVTTNEALEGANSHGIFDVHVFADEDFVGSFELPATIPILKNGNTTLNISAGIKNNGIVTQRIVYPFYAPMIVEMDLIPGAVQAVRSDSTAVFSYFENAFSIWYEGFEDVGNTISATFNSDTELETQDEFVASGLSSGKVELSLAAPYFEGVTNWELGNVPRGRTAYMEIDFRGNNPLQIGIQRGGTQPEKFFVIGLNPQESWTKVYIELSPTLGNFIGTQPFEFYFESILGPGTTSAEMYIDNIRFLYPVI
jgi:hypothetical protein